MMSTALSPNTLQPGRLPATAADPRETPSPSISHTCPLRGEMVLGQAQLAQVRTLGCQVLLLLGGHLSLPARRWPATQCPVLVGNVSSETMFIPSRGQQTPSPHHTPHPCSRAVLVPKLVMPVAWRIQPQRLHPHREDPCACKQSWLQALLAPPPSLVPSSLCPPSIRSSRIAGSSPGKCCRLLLFLPSNNIFPAQNNIGQVGGLLLLFQARLPLLPQTWRIPPVPRVTLAQGAFLFTSPGSSSLPCPIHPWNTFTPGWGSHGSHPTSGGPSGGTAKSTGQCFRSTQQQNALSPLT